MPMNAPQSGIFALGSPSHAYLEFDLRPRADGRSLVMAMADVREPRTTIGGVNLVSGFRPELWRLVEPDGLPADLVGFNEAIAGAEGFIMPATQHDAMLWLSGSSYDVVFDEARQAINALASIATVADETSSWSYRRYRDLTGFVDGTKNPSLLEAPEVAVITEGGAGAGGTILLLQKWAHDVTAWEALPPERAGEVIGRTKTDDVELDPQPQGSHVSRTDQEAFGDVFRRNMPYGTVTEHGTMFVGFCSAQRPLAAMLESMAGLTDGVRDALTRYTTPLSGAYYFVPSTQAIRAHRSSVPES